MENWDPQFFIRNWNLIKYHIFDALACKFNRPGVCLLAHLFPTDGPLSYLFSDHKVDHIFDCGSASQWSRRGVFSKKNGNWVCTSVGQFRPIWTKIWFTKVWHCWHLTLLTFLYIQGLQMWLTLLLYSQFQTWYGLFS